MRLVERVSGVRIDSVYSVSEVCRILQPGMTPRKVHYWLDTNLLSPSVVHGQRGTPTLLNFRQLLEIRTVQHLRDNLRFSLVRVRKAFEFILDNLFADSWSELTFVKGVKGQLVAQVGDGSALVVPGGQGVLAKTLDDLNTFTSVTRQAWEQRAFAIPDRPHLVSNARVQAGAPTVVGTRIETATIAAFSEKRLYTAETIAIVRKTYPSLSDDAVVEALEFEGSVAAA